MPTTPDSLAKLVSIAGEELRPGPPRWTTDCPGLNEERIQELTPLLSRKNGFYAFESALHVFSAAPEAAGIDVNLWNMNTTWKLVYDDFAEDCFCFAEDIFGVQFCFFDGHIWTFDPETGQKDYLAANLHEWATFIVGDYDALTGYPLAHEWQMRHGPLEEGKRLLPKLPFVLGGSYTSENLYAIEAVKGMRFRGELARQIRDYPDGTQVRYEVSE